MRGWNVALKEYLEEYYVGYLDKSIPLNQHSK